MKIYNKLFYQMQRPLASAIIKPEKVQAGAELQRAKMIGFGRLSDAA
jgi:hypothetical protein